MPAITAHSRHDITETEAAVRAALAEQGFGVHTEIDIAATFKAKLDLDRPPMKILGACNPHFAHQALETDPDAALVLPCNVVLEATEHGTAISAADPHDIITNPALSALADNAADRLRAALETVNGDSAQLT